MTKNNTLTQQYNQTLEELYNQLSNIKASLIQHNKQFDNLNWGNLGDLIYIKEQLSDIQAFLRQKD